LGVCMGVVLLCSCTQQAFVHTLINKLTTWRRSASIIVISFILPPSPSNKLQPSQQNMVIPNSTWRRICFVILHFRFDAEKHLGNYFR
jgi:hypothetical protein